MTAMTGTRDVHGLQDSLTDRPGRVRIQERQAGSGAPVPERTGLDVVTLQRFAQQRIIYEVDLSDGQVGRGTTPVGEGRELRVGGCVGKSGGPGRDSVHGVLFAWSAVF